MRTASWQLALLGALAFGSSSAQTVYRCGHSYSHEPCPQARTVEVQDARTEAQRAEALASGERQGLMANELAERRVREEATAATAAAGINGHRSSAEPARDKPKSKKRKSSQGEDYEAVVPGSGNKQKKR